MADQSSVNGRWLVAARCAAMHSRHAGLLHGSDLVLEGQNVLELHPILGNDKGMRKTRDVMHATSM